VGFKSIPERDGRICAGEESGVVLWLESRSGVEILSEGAGI